MGPRMTPGPISNREDMELHKIMAQYAHCIQLLINHDNGRGFSASVSDNMGTAPFSKQNK